MSSEKSPSSSTYHPSDLPSSSLSDTIPTDYDEEQQHSQPPSTDDESPIPTSTTDSTNTPSSIDHKFHLLENRLSGFAESLLGIATCLDSLQQQINSLSSSSSLSSTSTSLQKENDDDENSHSEEDKREAVVVDQEREEQKGVMMGEEKEGEVGGEESKEDEDTAEQRPEGGGDGKVNNEGFLGEVISGILNGDDGEVES